MDFGSSSFHRRSCMPVIIAVVITLVMGLQTTWLHAADTDKEVARVNGQVIYERDLLRHMKLLQPQVEDKDGTVDGERRKRLEYRVLNDLIGRELMYQESRKAGISVSDEEIQSELDSLRQRYGGEETFQQVLAKMDLSQEEMTHNIRQGKAVRKFIDQEIVGKITVSEKEMRDHYKKERNSFRLPEAVRASHILIKVAPDANPSEKETAMKEIVRIRKRIKAGEDFASLAKKFSEGPSASRGGELGFFIRGKMVKPFEDTAFFLKPGEVSGVVTTQFGYHVIKVVEHRPPSIESYQSAKPKIERFLRQGKIRNAIDDYIAGVEKGADIVRY